MAYKEKAVTGIPSWTCHCSEHVWAYPYDDELQHWRELRTLPEKMKSTLADKGIPVYRPAPPTLPHVILLSPQDAGLFKLRRWRVFRAPARKRTKFTVQPRVVGKALHRLVLPDAPIVQFVSGDGTDCRRENLKATTMADIKSRSTKVATMS